MDKPRFFLPKQNLQDKNIKIDGGENVHLTTVLRMRVNDEIDICLNDGYIYECVITEVGKKFSIAKINNIFLPYTRESKIILFLALTKAERMDWAVQKCTELGVDQIIPFESEFCTAKDKGTKTDRLIRVALSASKQSGRVNLPEINNTISFNEMLEKIKNIPQVVLAYEKDSTNTRQVLSKFDKTKDTAIIIGSEGGFSDREVQQLRESGANIVSLGSNILRTETACVALLSAVYYQFDFFERK